MSNIDRLRKKLSPERKRKIAAETAAILQGARGPDGLGGTRRTLTSRRAYLSVFDSDEC